MKGIVRNNRITVFEAGLPHRWEELTGLRVLPKERLYEVGIREVEYHTKTDYQKYGEPYLDENTDKILFTIMDKSEEEINIELINRKSDLIKEFESDTDELVKQTVGERGEEYRIAEEEATAFKTAGYPETDVPQSISSDAIAKNYSNVEACDLILTMAANWRAIQASVRAKRLLSKEQVRNSTTLEETRGILEEWKAFVEVVKAQIVT